MLRDLGVKAPIGFFLHTPFPTTEILWALPAHRELVLALCAYDLVGFKTERDLRAFRDYVTQEADGRVSASGRGHAFGRSTQAGYFPIGIDTEAFEHLARTTTTPVIATMSQDRAFLIGVDRLDYTKGMVGRVQAFGRFLGNHPEFRRRVTLLQIAPSSRSEIPEYRQVRRDLEVESSRVNGRYGDIGWVPVHYLNRSFTRAELAALYRICRIGIVTPLRDGMNLVAKEYVAAQDPANPGTLILSRFTGAARELDTALIVNPFNIDAISDAIYDALVMAPGERRRRWKAMMRTLHVNTIERWLDDYLSALEKSVAARLRAAVRTAGRAKRPRR